MSLNRPHKCLWWTGSLWEVFELEAAMYIRRVRVLLHMFLVRKPHFQHQDNCEKHSAVNYSELSVNCSEISFAFVSEPHTYSQVYMCAWVIGVSQNCGA